MQIKRNHQEITKLITRVNKLEKAMDELHKSQSFLNDGHDTHKQKVQFSSKLESS